MKRLIKIDEENILRSNLRISSGIFLIIILIVIIIYIPKYFLEYKDLQDSIKENQVSICKNKVRDDVNQLISTVEYHVEINHSDQDLNKRENSILDEINSSYQINTESYIFIYKILKMEGGREFAKMLLNPNRPDLIGKLIDDDYQDVKGNMFRKIFMNDIREKGESFVTYWYLNPKDSVISPKTAYFKFLPELNWIIAKGFYYTQIDAIIKSETIKYKNDFIKRTILLLILMSTALLLYYLTFKIILKKQEEKLKEYKNNLINKNTQLKEEINKSKDRELELKSLNNYITSLYDLAPVGIILVKVKDRTLVRINQTALNILDFKKEDIISQNCHEFFCPAQKNKCPIIDNNSSLDNSERMVINSKKENIPVLKNARRITIDNEDYILESFIDITEIKKTQNELIELRKNAENANVSKSRFLANMSHEIRTPMNVIMGMANLLLESETDKEKKNLLDSIKISSESLLNIINDILDLSKIESGKYTSEKISFNLYDLLSNIRDISLFKAKEKNIKFNIEYSKEKLPKFILGDEVRIKQIIINLVGNALKFTDSGSVKLILETISNNDSKTNIKFSVIDTGIGISKEALNNVFKRFTQADISTTRKYGGTGLGLTICEKLLSIMGSKLEVISIKGKGSEFFFELSVEIPDNMKTKNNIISNFSDVKKLKNIKILVAEDNSLNQKLIAAILNQKEINYTITNNGEETINMLSNESFDLILMDGQMPVMDGLEATNIIRNSDNEYKNIPIIALTASALIGDRQKFLDAGMNDYISKPIDIVELFEKISLYTNKNEFQSSKQSIENSNENNKIRKNNTSSIINLSDFEKKKKIFGKESYINILGMLLNDLDVKLDLIAKYLKTNDLKHLKHQTHSLKGIITNFDAPDINNLCKELDKYAIDENIEQMKIILNDIKDIAPQYKLEILEFSSSL